MNILSISDVVIPLIYSPQVIQRFPNVDLIINCGDLPNYYVEFVADTLGAALFYVHGNHAVLVEHSLEGPHVVSPGGTNLHGKCVNYNNLLLAGVEGSGWYRPGPFQYSQAEMWMHVLSLVPGLLINRFRHGRYLDIFVTHAPPKGVHDQEDLPHQGIKAFAWLITTFQPAYHFHGHVHIYSPHTVIQTRVGKTRVINTCGYQYTQIE